MNCPGPRVVPVKGPAGVGVAPLPATHVAVTFAPAAGTNTPLPRSSVTVTVNVCDAPTSFVAEGAIVIAAATHVLFAFGLSPGKPSPVSPWITRPPTETSVAAFTTVVPVVLELITTVQEPVPPDVVQVFGPTKLPGPLTFVKVITVPAGAFTNPPPRPSFTFTWPVRVWFVLIG